MIRIPEAFARGTIAREGEPGAAWIAELPAIVAELLERWRCAPDGDVLHGEVGVIVPVRRSGGRPAVMKVSFPHPGNVHEPDAFAAWGGRGAVLLYERADDRYAMLLERARPQALAELDDVDEIVTVAGELSRRLAVPAPPGLPHLRERAGTWEAELLKDAAELPHTMPPRVIDAAVATVREMAADQPDVLVHGDLHAGNILRGEREPWLAVDPKGVAGDPAYDVGSLVKALVLQLMAAGDLAKALQRALDVFAESAGLDRARVGRWAQLHAVQGALPGRRCGFAASRAGEVELAPLLDLADDLAGLLTE
jgi:streptomycin 6-kinase